jgi:hypothetical protein
MSRFGHQGTLERLWVRVSNLAETGRSPVQDGWRQPVESRCGALSTFQITAAQHGSTTNGWRMSIIESSRARKKSSVAIGCALQKLPGTDIDWNQSREFALLEFTPLSQHSCGLWAFCRAD